MSPRPGGPRRSGSSSAGGPRRPAAGRGGGGARPRPDGAPGRGPARRRPPAAPEEPPPRPRRGPVVFVATRNPGKVRELSALLEAGDFRVVGDDRLGRYPAPVEDGTTFEANARKKAIHYSRLVRHLVIADDSGLCVDALDGQPGVRSARLGGPAATDADRVRLILRKLEGVPWERRTAHFRCVIALARNGEVLATFDGAVEGKISLEPAGSAGFGYDPIFYFPHAEKTFAELDPAEKDRVSHRGQALERAVAWILEHRPAPRRSPAGRSDASRMRPQR